MSKTIPTLEAWLESSLNFLLIDSKVFCILCGMQSNRLNFKWAPVNGWIHSGRLSRSVNSKEIYHGSWNTEYTTEIEMRNTDNLWKLNVTCQVNELTNNDKKWRKMSRMSCVIRVYESYDESSHPYDFLADSKTLWIRSAPERFLEHGEYRLYGGSVLFKRFRLISRIHDTTEIR